MTREETIKGLKVLAKDFSGYRPNEEMFNNAIKALEQLEIIRCEECRHYRTADIFGKKLTMCKRREYDSVYTEPDDFCSYAERKEQDDG